jgi:hypothetical protein
VYFHLNSRHQFSQVDVLHASVNDSPIGARPQLRNGTAFAAKCGAFILMSIPHLVIDQPKMLAPQTIAGGGDAGVGHR